MKKKLVTPQKLQQNEENYRSMIERISDGFVSLDENCCYTYANSKAELIFRKPAGYLIGKNIWSEFPESGDKPFQTAYKAAMINQEYVYAEVYYELYNLWLENHIYPSPEGASVYFIDITESKKKADDFAKLAERNALILHTMQNSFLLTDADLNVIDVNPAFCEAIGYSRQDLLKMNVTDFDVQLSSDEIKRNLEIALQKGILYLETRNKRKDGVIIDVEVALTEMEIDGQVYFASFGRDISERKKADERIINEKKLSDSIINSLPGIFYLYNEHGKFLRWNKNFETVSMYSAAEIACMSPVDFFAEDEKEILKRAMDTVFKKGMAEVEAHFLTKDKEKIPYYFNGRLDHIEGRSCLIGMGIDISERIKAEESIRSMEQKILNQRVQEQKKISRAIIRAQETERSYIGRELHDNVNQILAATILYLKMAGKENAKMRKIVTHPLELLDNSINEIRSLSSKHVTPQKNINLKKLIQSLLDSLNKNTHIKTNFTYNIFDDIIDDELKLNIYRIVQEQVNNIIKHAACDNVSISAETGIRTIHIVVADDGKGFETNKKREGSGITNMINRVESFNGEIIIESSPGKGCQLGFKIPYSI
ncbi:MAG: PAS domain S-box protein [Ginsengibacter sp.]